LIPGDKFLQWLGSSAAKVVARRGVPAASPPARMQYCCAAPDVKADGDLARLLDQHKMDPAAEEQLPAREALEEAARQEASLRAVVQVANVGVTTTVEEPSTSLGEPHQVRLSFEMRRPPGMAWGMRLENWGRYLQVNVIRPEGALAEYNRLASADEHVFSGDVIIRINEAAGNADAMLGICKDSKASSLAIDIVRPRSLTLTVSRQPPKKWGFSFLHRDKLGGWVVTAVAMDGAVAVHNANHPLLNHVLVGDLIVRVNEADGTDPSVLKCHLDAASTVELSISRAVCD